MRKILFLLISIVVISSGMKPGQLRDSLSDALYGFENVQDSTRTKTWWFHGETETTKEGITADLEAFRRIGIGGVVYYDQSHGKAENALPGFSTEWWKMLRFSAEEAKRLGLTFEVHISNGFVAGGSWITDEYSMKRLAATERLVRGGKRFEGKLEIPSNKYNYSKDIAVLAFPAPQGAGISSLNRVFGVSSNVEGIDFNTIFDSRSGALTKIPIQKAGKSVYINLHFKEDFTARSISYEVAPRGKATTSATNVPGPPQDTFVGTGYRVLPDLGQLEVSEDGVNYRVVCDLKPIYKAHESWRQKTISFPAVKGKYYRLNLHDWVAKGTTKSDMQIGRVVIHSVAKIDRWEEKAAFFSEYIENDKTPRYSSGEAIDVSRVLNITDKMDDNGILSWDVPEGDWIVMRFASVLTGGAVKHGRKNLMGRECDKMSVAAAKCQWDNYVGRIVDSLKTTGNKILCGVAMDSHEAGSQNWTENFIEEFNARRNYDPTPFLPAMMGYVVTNVSASTGFLFDVRRNIADMIADNYYGTFEQLCRGNGLTFTAQATGNALCIVADPIYAKSKPAKPQGEFWPIHPDGNYDIKESSSSAHLYNKPIASAEAYTDVKYSSSIADLKTLSDYAYAFGINEFVICASAYQPWLDKIPGSTGGGRHYCINRNNTWWEYSAPFWDFQARCAYIMRKGKSAIDLCVYLGENPPVKILTYRLPDIPGGFDFDAFTSDALFTRMTVNAGRVALPDGVNYKMMILPRNGDITLEALAKIEDMVKQGIVVYGARPLRSGSGKDVGQEAEYDLIVRRLWGDKASADGVNHYGKGTVYWGMPLSEALEKAGVTPDVAMADGNTKDRMIYFAHRKLTDASIYFVANRKDRAEDNLFTFGAEGKFVQLWNPATGERYALNGSGSNKKGTSVRLYMAPRESFFVVITDKYEKLSPVMWYKPKGRSKTIEGAWDVFFAPKWGGPGNVVFEKLCDWTTHTHPGIKYYSGTAVYKKKVYFQPNGHKTYLDLGNPGFVARVFVNSHDAGIVWCSPWKLDITRYLHKGDNSLEIHVANSLINRMVLDASPLTKEKITYAYPPIVTPRDTLEPSGLKEVKLVEM